jgi:hypothetical protein
MNRVRALYFLAVLSFSVAAMAQAGKPAATPAPAPPPTIASAIEQQVGTIEREFVSAAEAMPEDKYNFAPTSLNINGSEFKGVRTFAEQVKHVAATNYLLWGAITGDSRPLRSRVTTARTHSKARMKSSSI